MRLKHSALIDLVFIRTVTVTAHARSRANSDGDRDRDIAGSGSGSKSPRKVHQSAGEIIRDHEDFSVAGSYGI